MKEEIFLSLRRENALKGFIGKHPSFIHLIEKLEMLADKDVSILLIGETGTGKGCCAEIVHQYGRRYRGPFIPFNCGAGPESLFESQLFGHIKGAFTGAHKDHPGLVEEAHTGILFLDEVNSLDCSVQVKLNHFLETGQFRRLGENRFRKSDIRIVAASLTDLREDVQKGTFRKDLYFRLAEYELHVPALRDRQEDIVLLVKYFLKKNAHLNSNGQIAFTPKAFKELKEYSWPGNIRELENFVKRSLIDASSTIIDSVNLPQSSLSSTSPTDNFIEALPWKQAKQKVVSLFERKYLQNLLREYHGIVANCARHAGIQPSDFWKLMRKYDLKAQKFRRTNI